MRILLAAKFVPTGRHPIGGVQSWIRTVRAELEQRGHFVDEWMPGMMLHESRYGFGVFSNLALTYHIAEFCDHHTTISHGIIDAEKPVPGSAFVSEGVRDFWGGQGRIIRQPIDLDFWKPQNKKRQGAVRYSYRNTKTLCERAAKALGMSYTHVSGAMPEEARDILTGAALVFASGRAALEAMACGAPTVIYDHRAAYQGPLMDNVLVRQMRNSYSGRAGWSPSVEDLVLAANAAKPRRDWVKQHHDARAIVDQILTEVGL